MNIPTSHQNPGDLKDPSTGQIKQFSDSKEGYGALLNDLQGKISGKTSTGLGPNSSLIDFSKVYAPASDNNNPGQYAANLANKMGVAPNATLGSLQPQLGKFAEAVASNEGFASSEPQPQSNKPTSTPNIDNWLFGLGGAALGGISALAGKAGELLTPSPEKLVGAAEGALAGEGAGALLTPVLGPLGLAVGPIGGGIAGYLSAGNSKNTQQDTTSQSTQGTQPDMSQLFALEQEMSQAQQHTNTLAQSITQALQVTPSGRVLSQDKGTQEAIQTGAKYGFSPDITEGNMDFSNALKKSQGTIADLSKSASEILSGEGTTGNKENIKSEARANLRKYAPAHEWDEGDKVIENAVESYAKNFGDKSGNIPLHQVQRIKQETGYGQKWNVADTTAKRAAFKAISSGARTTIENNTKNKEFYNAVMKEEQKLINNQKIMKRLNGKKAPENAELKRELLKTGGRLAASYIGDKIGGPVGAVLGYLVSRHVVNGIDERFGKTIFETPEMQKTLKGLASHHPAVFKRIEIELKKAGWKVEEGKSVQRGLLKLSAPAIRMAPETKKSEGLVVGGKRPPTSFEQAKKRKQGKPEFGSLYKGLVARELSKKAAGLSS